MFGYVINGYSGRKTVYICSFNDTDALCSQSAQERGALLYKSFLKGGCAVFAGRRKAESFAKKLKGNIKGPFSALYIYGSGLAGAGGAFGEMIKILFENGIDVQQVFITDSAGVFILDKSDAKKSVRLLYPRFPPCA